MKNRITKTLLPLLAVCGLAVSGCSQGESNSVTSNGSTSTQNSSESSKSSTSSSKENSSISSSEKTSSSSSEAKVISAAITGSQKIKIEGTTTLTATVTNATNTSVTWDSLNPEIATVNAGVVTGVAVGEATIKATSVEDTTKSATIVITVIDKYDFRVTENKTYTAEVENLDLSQFVVRADGLASHPTAESCIEASDETTYGTSGGKSIGFIGQNTILTASFYSEKAFVLTPMVRMADAGASFDVDANIAFTVDSSSVDSNGYTTFGGTDTNQYWNWKDVSLDTIILDAGAHTFTYKITGSQGINLDCFKFAVADYDDTGKYYQIGENGTITAEAENLDLTNFVVRADAVSVKPTAKDCIESSDEATYGTSGGKSIGFIGNGTVLKVNLFLKDESVVTPIARMASADATFDVDGNSTFKVDETAVDSNGYKTFGSTDTNTYYNWKDVKLDSVSLKAGFHTFTYTCKGAAINLDAFKFTTAYYNVLATINANKTIDDPYLVEAEDCDTSGCTLQAGCNSFFEEPKSTIPTSGGECIACISAPSILAFKIDVKGTCDISFYTVAAKYEDPWNLDGNVSYYLDSNTPFVTGYSAFGHTTENMFYNWKTVELGTTTGVTSGVHQFNIKVLGSFPNTDCFKMVVTNYTAA